MTDESWSHANEILAEALEREPHERPAFLRDACAGDEKLRIEVQALIALEDKAASLLETSDLQVTLEATTGEHTPARIGRYEVRRIIASGGMGTVYEATQDHPHRLVAVKVLRRGAASSKAMKRFQHEAEILGRLRHANIAQVYEAGSFDDGQGAQPYFAMELVKGQTLIDHAEAKRLESRPRLELFAKVCDAVQYAHHKGIIHRDLKPDNILVDDFGEPKILDFGIARATDSDLQVTTLRTDIGQLIGTIPYMSPEQVTGDPEELDMRSDVYSLGVVLYELLCGRLPHDLKERSIPDAVRIIREDDPAPLSSINRVYRGDVETIVAKALAKEKPRRYQSAAELATDLRHYLSDEPIEARPASTFYQLRKFTRRNRALVGGVVVAFAALSLGTGAATWQALVANRAEKQAVMQADIAEAVNDFLNQDLLAAVAPSAEKGRGKDVLMRDVLDEAAKRIDDASGVGGRFAEKPLVEASIRQTLGETYQQLGEYGAAKPHLERARDLRRRELGEEHTDTLASMNTLALLFWNQGRYDKAVLLFMETLEISKRVLGEEHKHTVKTMGNLALLYSRQGRYEEAEPLSQKTLEIQKRVLGEEHLDTLKAMNNLALLYSRQGRYDEAEPLFLETLEIRKRVLGEEHPDTLSTMGNLALLYWQQGRYDKAEQLGLETLEIHKRILGEEHPDTLKAMINLALLYSDQARYDKAEQLGLETLQICKRVLGEEHPDTLTCTNNLADVYSVQGRDNEAEPLYRETLEIRKRVLGDEHPETLFSMMNLGGLHYKQGYFERARALQHEAVAVSRRVWPEGSWFTGAFLGEYGPTLIKLERYEDAEVALLDAHETLTATRGPDFERTISVMESLAELYDAWAKPDQAGEWRAKLPTEQDAVTKDPP